MRPGLSLMALAIIISTPARAQDPGWYAGASFGASKAKVDDGRITSFLLGNGFVTAKVDEDNANVGFKVFAGYQFTRHFSLEGGYFNLGHFSYAATTLPPGVLNGDIRVQGLDLGPVLSLPVTDRFSLFARAGLTFVQARDAFNGTGFVQVLDPGPRKTALNYTFGGGLQYEFTRCVAMRAEAQRYRIDDAIGNKGDLDLVSLGLLVRLGRRAHAPVQAGRTSAPAVLAPGPVRVVVPVPAATQQYCTILDLQFDIDRDEILREDKERLLVVGTYLTRYPATTAVIEGHTDNVGAPDHNLDLSLRRAQSVVNYLVDTLHLDRARFSAAGYGDTRPLADNATEEGKRRNRRIDAVIACVTDVAGLTVAPARMTMALAIEFDQNQADIRPENDDQLQKVAIFLKANPAVTATVEGHTGNVQASHARAMEISNLRAQRVVDYLVGKLGIDRTRLSVRAYGDERRFAYNTSAEGREENRRVNIIINYPK